MYKLFNKNENRLEIENPKIDYDVGSHIITVHIITVLEDFFDLPIFRDWFKMFKFKKAFMTYLDKDENKETKKENKNKMMSYFCVYDSLKSSCMFRLARILKHFSVSIVIGSFILSIIFIKYEEAFDLLKKIQK